MMKSYFKPYKYFEFPALCQPIFCSSALCPLFVYSAYRGEAGCLIPSCWLGPWPACEPRSWRWCAGCWASACSCSSSLVKIESFSTTIKWYTKRQNELYSEVWKLFSQSSTDVPALLPCAMLPRQARKLTKNSSQNLLHSSSCHLVD